MTTSTPLNILVIGGGGREHAIVKALKRSPRCAALYCSPGNGGIQDDATCLTLDTPDAIANFCINEGIDLVVIGPEQPLVEGLSDFLRAKHITVFGCSQAAAQLEASKTFTKMICDEAAINTAWYGSFTDAAQAQAYLKDHPLPVVLKADGLAAGKGVIICQTHEEASTTLEEMFAGKFGEASRTVVIEEFLEGEELSFFALCDGDKAFSFGSAQDHKAAYDGDTGPNTGGMGTYSPAPVMTDALETRIMDDIVTPALQAMKARGTPYQGILFVGLMVKDGTPRLIEFNVRLGDPETQVILTRLESDLAALLYDAAQGALPDTPLQFSQQAALCVVMAANGYPGAYQKGSVIGGIDALQQADDLAIYHAGTKQEDGRLLAHGGRVLGVTALGATVREAQQRAYEAVDAIDWPDGFCRRDIGWRAVG